MEDLYTNNLINNPVSWNTDLLSGAAFMFYDSEDTATLKTLPWEEVGDASKSVIKDGFIDIPLLITGAQTQMTDYHKIESYIGDMYAVHFFGKAPVIYNFTGKVLNTGTINEGAFEATSDIDTFRNLYKELFRIKAVAKHRIAPQISFTGCVLRGAMLSLNIGYSSQIEDYCPVQFQFLALNITYINPDNTVNAEAEGRLGISQLDIDFVSDGSKALIESYNDWGM